MCNHRMFRLHITRDVLNPGIGKYIENEIVAF